MHKGMFVVLINIHFFCFNVYGLKSVNCLQGSKKVCTFAVSKDKGTLLTHKAFMIMNKIEWFKNEISYLTKEEQVALFNDYCIHTKKYDSYIYPMDMLNEHLKDKTPREIVKMCCNHNVNYKDKYFVSNNLGLLTFENPVDYINGYGYCYDIFEIEDVWKRYIDEDDYVNYLYEKLYDLKPDYMDCLVYLEIISNAEAFLFTEEDIKIEVTRQLKKLGVEL